MIRFRPIFCLVLLLALGASPESLSEHDHRHFEDPICPLCVQPSAVEPQTVSSLGDRLGIEGPFPAVPAPNGVPRRTDRPRFLPPLPLTDTRTFLLKYTYTFAR